MSRDQFPTTPEGISGVTNQLTLLWIEIGERGTYQIGRRALGITDVYLQTTLSMRSISRYLPDLRLDVVFIMDAPRSSPQATARIRTDPFGGMSEVDELLSDRPSRVSTPPLPPTTPVPPRGPADQIRAEFVEISTVPGRGNLKRLRVRHLDSLSFRENTTWKLQIGFSNFPQAPRLLRPAASNIIPDGF